MLRTTAFAVLCIILAAYGVFKLDDAYSTFVSDAPDPAGSRQVVKRKVNPIAEADAYALSQIAPSAGGRRPTPAPASKAQPQPRTLPKAPDTKELLELLSESGGAPASLAKQP